MRNGIRVLSLFAASAVVVASLTGCHSLQRPQAGTPLRTSAGTVLVGGEVRNPQQVRIGLNGLTLLDAITLCGGAVRQETQQQATLISESPVANSIRDLDVSLQDLEVTVRNLTSVCTPANKEALKKTIAALTDSVCKLSRAVEAAGLTQEQVELDSLVVSVKEPANKLLEKCQTMDAVEAQEQQKRFIAAAGIYRDFYNRLKSKMLSVGTVASLPAIPTLLVALQRGNGVSAVTYYFPLDFVNNAVGNAIAVEDNDRVMVVRMDETTLSSRFGSNQHDVTVTGFVTNAGVAKATHLGDLLSAGMNRQLGIEPLRELNTKSAVIVLTRRARSGLGQEAFVIPYRDSRFNGAATAAGDNYHLIPVVQMPILRKSLVAALVSGPLRATGYKPRPKPGTIERYLDDSRRQTDNLFKPLRQSSMTVIPDTGPNR